MRYLIALLFTVAVNAQTYLINQNYEGTGYDNSETWTESNAAAFNEDYAVTPLRGSQSMLATQQSIFYTTLSPSFTAASEVWIYMMFRLDQAPTTTTNFLSLNTATTQFGVNPTTGKWYVKSGGAANVESTVSYSVGQVYYIWLHYVKGFGANAVLQMFISTDGVKPATPIINVTNGNQTSDASTIRFATVNNAVYVVDWLLVDDEEIGTLVEVETEKQKNDFGKPFVTGFPKPFK